MGEVTRWARLASDASRARSTGKINYVTDDETPTYPTDLGMVCSCAAEDKVKLNALVDEVTRRLKTDPAHFLTKVAWSLRVKHRVAKWSVSADQWFLITSTKYGGDSAVLQADELEHGLAAVWVWYADGRTPGLDDEPQEQTPTDD